MVGAKILIVDDEPRILKILEASLRKEGYSVAKATDGEEALRLVETEYPDLIVLDLMLPKLDGFEVCRRIRSKLSTPILILSAKTEELDKIMGFTLGVDDYLTKPFSPAELVFRVKAILRRTMEHNPTGTGESVSLGSLEVDHKTRMVKIRGTPLELTAKEFDLLWLLVSHPNQVFTRDQLLNQVWDTDYFGDTNTVTVLVKRLREKIEEDPANPHYIKTVWGVGYKLVV